MGKHQVMATVPGSLQGGQPSARGNPGAGGKHGGHSHSILSLKVPCFQMPSTKSSPASPHTCPTLAASHRNVFVARVS